MGWGHVAQGKRSAALGFVPSSTPGVILLCAFVSLCLIIFLFFASIIGIRLCRGSCLIGDFQADIQVHGEAVFVFLVLEGEADVPCRLNGCQEIDLIFEIAWLPDTVPPLTCRDFAGPVGVVAIEKMDQDGIPAV